MIALRKQQVTKLQHSNIATKHMTLIYRRCLRKDVEHHEANISIYYMRETELCAESYDAMNKGTYCKIIRTWKKSGEGREVNLR